MTLFRLAGSHVGGWLIDVSDKRGGTENFFGANTGCFSAIGALSRMLCLLRALESFAFTDSATRRSLDKRPPPAREGMARWYGIVGEPLYHVLTLDGPPLASLSRGDSLREDTCEHLHLMHRMEAKVRSGRVFPSHQRQTRADVISGLAASTHASSHDHLEHLS